jgi:hypothetical protein
MVFKKKIKKHHAIGYLVNMAAHVQILLQVRIMTVNVHMAMRATHVKRVNFTLGGKIFLIE